ncbi:hypothetical protein EDD40_7378 [Saccharothrix texasensis]|uniref:Uncharacterized protein n=1 Tax=Saccharothrix texasensis TaxID=103734 RepID=A0A3N1HHA7_9PSEU|nr:hypothetical protein EDD40_7378 [Saccharothrix texasensis]
MMTGCVAPTGLPRRDQRVRVAAPAAHERPGKGHGDLGAAASDRRPGTATRGRPSTVLPRRPGFSRGPAAPTPGASASSTATTGTPGDDSAVAPGPPSAQPRRQVPSQGARSTTDRPLDPAPGAAPGTRESHLGLPPHPRRTPRARHQCRRIHGMADPRGRRNRPGTRTHHDDMVSLPLRTGRRAPGLRLFRDHHPEQHPPVPARGHRARQSPGPRARRHHATDRGMGHPSRQNSSWTSKTQAAQPDPNGPSSTPPCKRATHLPLDQLTGINRIG